MNFCHYVLAALALLTVARADGLADLGIEKCPATSYQISQFGAEQELEPCLLYDIAPSNNSTSGDVPFAEVALVQVTPSICHNHRDGANTAVRFLNGDNSGRGVAIGYGADSYVKFRLISIIGGNNKNIGNDAYSEIHQGILDSVFDHVNNVQFVLGSCSFAAAADTPVVKRRQKIVLSQVGPPGFYMDVKTNPYVFGIHVNSDTYPIPALQALQFHLNAANIPKSSQSVKVIYRDRSEFFNSTCRSAIDVATSKGFDVTAIMFNPDADDTGAGVPNSQNVEFLEALADQVCDPDSGSSANPAVFACVQGGEADAILARLRSNGCRPTMAWFTTATWGWAIDNADVVPYFQGGGQWHQNFKYSDRFFQSGNFVLDHGLEVFGYKGTYDHVVSYAMPMLVAELVQSFFRIVDAPDVAHAFKDRYEELRRSFFNMNAHTIFGPISFNEWQRNNGRGAAGTQWIPVGGDDKDDAKFVLECISPSDQADASVVIPSPSARQCLPGSHISQELVETHPAILENKCATCLADTFAPSANTELECVSCPDGSSSDEGSSNCVMMKDNLLPSGLMGIGYASVAISWCVAITYIRWVWMNRTDFVVMMSQMEFLYLICAGAMISTSAIIPLTLAEAAPGEDTTAASMSCMAFPFLYSLGWVLMYSSLTAKSWRLMKVSIESQAARRVRVTARDMYRIIIAVVSVDLAILIAWTAVDPLKYEREEVSKTLDRETGILTIETVGLCHSNNNVWPFLGPIIGIHVCLMIVTNALLWKVKDISDRYQEQKYVAIASLYTCELLLLGLPILIAVSDSSLARYIVMAGVIFLTDTGVLSLIFVPKIKYAKEGLPEGQTVVQSMM